MGCLRSSQPTQIQADAQRSFLKDAVEEFQGVKDPGLT